MLMEYKDLWQSYGREEQSCARMSVFALQKQGKVHIPNIISHFCPNVYGDVYFVCFLRIQHHVNFQRILCIDLYRQGIFSAMEKVSVAIQTWVQVDAFVGP